MMINESKDWLRSEYAISGTEQTNKDEKLKILLSILTVLMEETISVVS